VIEVKSPSLFKGYLNLPEKTKAEFTADGFFITGDMGEIDEKGIGAKNNFMQNILNFRFCLDQRKTKGFDYLWWIECLSNGGGGCGHKYVRRKIERNSRYWFVKQSFKNKIFNY
jgi:acyl-CoA synthetase (AMP-forming)/AMP-acid ligase II